MQTSPAAETSFQQPFAAWETSLGLFSGENSLPPAVFLKRSSFLQRISVSSLEEEAGGREEGMQKNKKNGMGRGPCPNPRGSKNAAKRDGAPRGGGPKNAAKRDGLGPHKEAKLMGPPPQPKGFKKMQRSGMGPCPNPTQRHPAWLF